MLCFPTESIRKERRRNQYGNLLQFSSFKQETCDHRQKKVAEASRYNLRKYMYKHYDRSKIEIFLGSDKSIFNDYWHMLWELESAFTDIFKMFISLDDFRKSAVDGLIKAELLRCHEQSSVADITSVKLSLKLN